MKTIPLTQGKTAIVDDDDFEQLNQFKWYFAGDYAVRNISVNNKQHIIRMHRQILGLERGDGKESDHVNHNLLDNRKTNLRTCTHSQNQHNRLPQQSVSKFKGVTWDKRHKYWQARIVIDGKQYHLGYYNTEELAALAYDIHAAWSFGEFAKLNF